jgi:hypothetical protein
MPAIEAQTIHASESVTAAKSTVLYNRVAHVEAGARFLTTAPNS